jgi:hypothetical protein
MINQYLKSTFLFIAIAFILLITLNVIVDPFALFEWKVPASFHQEKPALTANYRAFKLREIKTLQPENMIFGSSRAQIGFSALKDNLGCSFYNAGLPQTTIDETAAVFHYAHQNKPLKNVIITVDFFSFNSNLKSLSPFDKSLTDLKSYDPFTFQDKTAALIGWSGTEGSIQTLWHYFYSKKNQQDININPNLTTSTPIKTQFENNERYYVEKKIYLPFPSKVYSLIDQKTQTSTLSYYEAMLKTCERDNIHCVVVIMPVHTRHLELIHALGLWEESQHWKKALTEITQRTAKNIPLYDFSHYHPINAERVPEKDSPQQIMQGFIDSAHITPKLGCRLFETIWLGKLDPDNYGVRLQNEMIEAYLSKSEQEAQQYRQAHTDLQQEIRELVQKYQ